jgi:hypothetical protein
MFAADYSRELFLLSVPPSAYPSSSTLIRLPDKEPVSELRQQVYRGLPFVLTVKNDSLGQCRRIRWKNQTSKESSMEFSEWAPPASSRTSARKPIYYFGHDPRWRDYGAMACSDVARRN